MNNKNYPKYSFLKQRSKRNFILAAAACIAVLAAGLIFIVFTFSSSASDSSEGRVVGIANKCMDIRLNQRYPGNRVQIWDCNGTAAQQWALHADGSLQSKGWCLDVKHGQTGAATPVWLYTCNGTPAQRWEKSTNGSIVNPVSGLCLDVMNAGTSNGNSLWLWKCNSTAAQIWQLPGTSTLSRNSPVVSKDALYVSPNGNDSSGTGSKESPFKSVEKAQSIVSPAGTVYMRGGTYSGTLNINKSGKPGKPIVYSSYPSEKVVVAGSSNEFYGQGIVFVKQVHDVTIQGIEFRDGNGQGIKVEASSNIVLKDNIVHDTQLGTIVVSGTNILVQGNEVYNGCLMNEDSKAVRAGLLAPSSLSSEKTPSGEASRNVQFVDNNSHDNWGEGINMWMVNGGTVKNNEAVNNYSVNIYNDDSKNIQIIDNRVASFNSTHDAIHSQNDQSSTAPIGIAVNSETQFQQPTNIVINNNRADGRLLQKFQNLRNGNLISQQAEPQSF